MTKRKYNFPVPNSERKKPFFRHGNWVGPGWSAGQAQDSVIAPNVPATDAFDQTAKNHDQAYAWINANVKDSRQKSKALERADAMFTKANATNKPFHFSLLDLKREIAGAGVNIQRIGRDIWNKDPETEVQVPSTFITPDKVQGVPVKIGPRGMPIRNKVIDVVRKKLSKFIIQYAF